MSETSQSPAPKAHSAAQGALVRRLIDVVALPGSRIPLQDRLMAGDILLDMLLHVTDRERGLCASRLAVCRDAPRRLLRYLAQCSFAVARPLLEVSDAFDACDLVEIVENTTTEHRSVIARRRNLCVAVTASLIQAGEPEIVQGLLANRNAPLAEATVDRLIGLSRYEPSFCPLLAERAELRASHAMAMFWWADSATRRKILTRHASDRSEIISICRDVFEMAAAEGWSDATTRKALQLIERRQRNRAAIARSVYDSLEGAVAAAAANGIDAELAQEIGYLAGIKPVTAAKILSDAGGEGLAVLCKATGLKREYVRMLWTALRRPIDDAPGQINAVFSNVAETYEVLSVAKAQTTLRYWNWSLSSAYSPGGLRQVHHMGLPANEIDAYSTSQRTARLVFGN